MIHIASKVCDEHCLRMRALGEWERALWWMGVGCIVLAAGLVWLGDIRRGLAMAVAYWPIAMARDACGRAVEREAERLRDDLVKCACRERGDGP